nr:hypothetical protein CFP56_56039 [Quercus suber]
MSSPQSSERLSRVLDEIIDERTLKAQTSSWSMSGRLLVDGGCSREHALHRDHITRFFEDYSTRTQGWRHRKICWTGQGAWTEHVHWDRLHARGGRFCRHAYLSTEYFTRKVTRSKYPLGEREVLPSAVYVDRESRVNRRAGMIRTQSGHGATVPRLKEVRKARELVPSPDMHVLPGGEDRSGGGTIEYPMRRSEDEMAVVHKVKRPSGRLRRNFFGRFQRLREHLPTNITLVFRYLLLPPIVTCHSINRHHQSLSIFAYPSTDNDNDNRRPSPTSPDRLTTMAGGVPMNVAPVQGGYLTGKKLIFPICLIISLFFLWGFSYGLLE